MFCWLSLTSTCYLNCDMSACNCIMFGFWASWTEGNSLTCTALLSEIWMLDGLFEGAVSARLQLILFIFSTVSSVHTSASARSDEYTSGSLLASWAIYICLTPLRSSSLLGCLHNMLVGHLQLFYFLSHSLQRLCNLIYDWIQIIYYYAHFWDYFDLRFLH